MTQAQQDSNYDWVNICPVKITKGKKRFMLNGIDLFIRPVKGLTFIYEASTGRQLMCIEESKKSQAFELILHRKSEVLRMIECINSSGHSMETQ